MVDVIGAKNENKLVTFRCFSEILQFSKKTRSQECKNAALLFCPLISVPNQLFDVVEEINQPASRIQCGEDRFGLGFDMLFPAGEKVSRTERDQRPAKFSGNRFGHKRLGATWGPIQYSRVKRNWRRLWFDWEPWAFRQSQCFMTLQ